MPDYKKNKRKSSKSVRPFKPKIKDPAHDIVMDSVNNSNLHIIKGKKQRNKRKKAILAIIVVSVILLSVLLAVLIPTGIFDGFEVFFSTLGFSSYPSEISGSELLQLSEQERCFFTLSDTSLQSFSNTGKNISSFLHGYSAPLMSVSDNRCLLYDQGKNSLSLYNAKKFLFSLETEFQIFTADISDNGTFAVTTKSEEYTSMVTVYSKNGDKIYEWFNPDEILSSVKLSSNGKYFALSGIKAVNGEYKSTVYIISVGNSAPDISYDYDGYVYDIVGFDGKKFAVVTAEKTDVIDFSDHTVVSLSSDYFIQAVRCTNSRICIASAIDPDSAEYNFDVYDKTGTLKYKFKISSNVKDYKIYGNDIVILCDNKIYYVDKNGIITKQGDCDFGMKCILPVGKNYAVTASDNNLIKNELKKVEKVK